MNVKLTTLAAAAGCAFAVVVPAGTAAAGTPATAPHFLPQSTSWITPERGIVLGYTSPTAGAKPYLYQTSDGGLRWQRLDPPPVRWPADDNQPSVTWADGVITVDNGSRIVLTRDGGKRWSPLRLPGLSASTGRYLVSGPTITDHRMFAEVDKYGSNTRAGSSAIYSGPVTGDTLRPVPGLSVKSVKGGETYGAISSSGVLQIALGHDYSAGRYWYSRDGLHFTPGPLPCPASMVASPGGVPGGKPVALCNGEPSGVGIGQNSNQIWTASRLGGTYHPSTPVSDSPNSHGFAVASGKDMVILTTFALMATFDGGHKWTNELTANSGAFWSSLAFLSATTGVVVRNTINNSGQFIAELYRTTDSGRAWHALKLP
jgi:hypothetical protein